MLFCKSKAITHVHPYMFYFYTILSRLARSPCQMIVRGAICLEQEGNADKILLYLIFTFFGSTLFNQHLQCHPSWSYYQVIFIMTLKVSFNISTSGLDTLATLQFLLHYNRNMSVGNTVKQNLNWICEPEACYPPTSCMLSYNTYHDTSELFFCKNRGTKDKTAWHSWNGTHHRTAIITCSPLSGTLSEGL